tara:strand:+ start:359 stop:553 length:195 start_codon:yes stop_codon:yes gene_type:complete
MPKIFKGYRFSQETLKQISDLRGWESKKDDTETIVWALELVHSSKKLEQTAFKQKSEADIQLKV